MALRKQGTFWRCVDTPFVDAFVAGLDLTAAAFVRVTPKATGRPGYDPKDLLELYIRLSKPRSLHPGSNPKPTETSKSSGCSGI